MLWLQRGDRLPLVAWAQKVLNEDPRRDTELKVDGAYGTRTKNRVASFQKSRGIKKDGVLGPDTWKQLQKVTTDRIVNYVGDGDAVFFRTGRRSAREEARVGRPGLVDNVASSIIKMGGDFIVSLPNQNAQAHIVSELRRRTRDGGKLGLLRLYGHGRPAHQNLSTGRGGYWDHEGGRWDFDKMRFVGGKTTGVSFGSRGGVALSDGLHKKKGEPVKVDPVSSREALSFMAQIKPFFAPLGSIELHGCMVAAGSKGRAFVAKLAMTVGAPVTAAVGRSKVGIGSDKLTLRVEAPRFTFYPLATDLSGWAKSRARKGDRGSRPASAAA